MNITEYAGYRLSVFGYRQAASSVGGSGGVRDNDRAMTELGRILILFGVLLVVFGLLLVFGGRLHLPIGRLPGDIVYRGKNSTVYFPIVTSIVISIVLSVIFYLIGRFSR